jgi:hypothetical protein
MEGKVRTLEAERRQRLYDVRRPGGVGGGVGGGARGQRHRPSGGGGGLLLGAVSEDERGGVLSGPATDDDQSQGGATLLDELGDHEMLGADENIVEVRGARADNPNKKQQRD